MTAAVFVDTNVLLYAVDNRDLGKQARAREWLAQCWKLRCGRLSYQVINEFYANARKRFAGALTMEQARAQVRRYQRWGPWVVDQATIDTAWDVESRFHINYWDALMVAAAQHIGCTVLLTEDMQHQQQIDGLRIVNPFLAGPALLDTPPA